MGRYLEKVRLFREKMDSQESGYRCWCKHHDKFHKNDVCGICQNQAYKGDPLANWSYRHPIQDVFPEVSPFNTYDYVKEIAKVQNALIKHMEKRQG